MNQTKKLTISGMVIALYVVIMYMTQSFAFGAYQIRIATSLYALSYIYPFLVIPLGISNLISNLLLGGMGIMDIVGGTFVGIITSFCIYRVHKANWNKIFIIPIIILGPGLIVPVWLSGITGVPYSILAVSLCIGQTIPAITGWMLIKALTNLPIATLAETNN